MKLQMTIGAIALLGYTVSVLADPGLEESIEISYVGSSIPKDVCRAVIEDDVQKLHRLLRSEKMNALYGYSFDAVSPEISGSFYCNDMNLQTFAQEVNAHRVKGYLASGGDRRASDTFTASN